MSIFYNNVPTELPNDYMSLADLAKWKNLPDQGVAIALNDKLIRREQWPVTQIQDMDRISVITAAFGG
ncbi:MAG: sulfur carrier protein ThiS [Muribaculaceae bacterium]|nr:sulfur carrier protein ThiS [Muribaculaceae bacterium]